MDQIRIGMIGARGRGGIANSWHQPGDQSVVAAAADMYPEKLKEFPDSVNSEAFVTLDYRELLQREDIDAIAVTSPDFCHEEHAVVALGAGKHVFCEKPLAIMVVGYTAAQLIRSYGGITLVSHVPDCALD